VDRPVANNLVVAGEVVHSFEDDHQNVKHNTEDLQQRSVLTSDRSQHGTGASHRGRICCQYQRQRAAPSASDRPDSSLSRLDIASNLL